ncbi:hypothetical protein TruAng_000125 [Truncatella angustata]|nr:hypothetical protein TruAng_000125 [Truncatella angustata]
MQELASVPATNPFLHESEVTSPAGTAASPASTINSMQEVDYFTAKAVPIRASIAGRPAAIGPLTSSPSPFSPRSAHDSVLITPSQFPPPPGHAHPSVVFRKPPTPLAAAAVHSIASIWGKRVRDVDHALLVPTTAVCERERCPHSTPVRSSSSSPKLDPVLQLLLLVGRADTTAEGVPPHALAHNERLLLPAGTHRHLRPGADEPTAAVAAATTTADSHGRHHTDHQTRAPGPYEGNRRERCCCFVAGSTAATTAGLAVAHLAPQPGPEPGAKPAHHPDLDTPVEHGAALPQPHVCRAARLPAIACRLHRELADERAAGPAQGDEEGVRRETGAV